MYGVNCLMADEFPILIHLDKTSAEVKRRFLFWLRHYDRLDIKEDETKRVLSIKKLGKSSPKNDGKRHKELAALENRLSKANIGILMRKKRGEKWNAKDLSSIKLECHASGEVLDVKFNDEYMFRVSVTKTGNIEIDESTSSPIELVKLVEVLETECILLQ